MNIIKRAADFAAQAHGTQKRKYTGDPYTVHTTAVAALVASVGLPDFAVAAAHLHDVVEDTPVTLDDIEERFGRIIRQLVCEVTDVSKPSDGNRAQRKTLDRIHLAGGSGPAHSIKVADLIDNSHSIMQHDPAFAKIYLAEKWLLLNVLTRAHPTLLKLAHQQIQEHSRA